MVVIVSVFKRNSGHVGLDLADLEEHLVDFLIVIGVRTSQVVALSSGFFHLEAVDNGEGDIVHEDGLNFSVHTFDLPKHSVEHLHVHTPLGGDGRVGVEALDDVGGTEDGNIGADSLDFLLTNPLGSKTLALGVGISTGGRHINKAFDLG